LKSDNPLFQFNLHQNVRGLIALALLFDLYAIYQQVVTNRLHRRVNKEIEANVRLKMLAEEFRDLAMRDPLTGLYNRRLVDERLTEEVARSKRHGHPLAVLAIDLDNFKQINDRHGHAAGDMVLRAFADRLTQAMRVSDVAARIGGDEFLALLPECHPGQVERVLARLSPLDIEFRGQKIAITVSTGWADYVPGNSPQHLLERADEALYANKQSRN
jgi:diguanylate cyclase (GGDEF)-like protein